jgi:hypothetical protein
MLRPNSSPIARALSSARSPARVSSLPHSHRKTARPSSRQSCSCPRSTSFSPHAHSKTTHPEGSRKLPDSEGCSDPKELRTFAPFTYFVVTPAEPPRKRNVNLSLLEVA